MMERGGGERERENYWTTYCNLKHSFVVGKALDNRVWFGFTQKAGESKVIVDSKISLPADDEEPAAGADDRGLECFAVSIAKITKIESRRSQASQPFRQRGKGSFRQKRGNSVAGRHTRTGLLCTD